MGRLEVVWAGLALVGMGAAFGVAVSVGAGVVLLLLGVTRRRVAR